MAVYHFVPLLVAVQANAGAQLAAARRDPGRQRLPPGLNGRGLLPMLLLFDPLSQYVGA